LPEGAVNIEVEFVLPGGDKIVAIVTEHSVESRGPVVGKEAIVRPGGSLVPAVVSNEALGAVHELGNEGGKALALTEACPFIYAGWSLGRGCRPGGAFGAAA
jgi:hypothetical protein